MEILSIFERHLPRPHLCIAVSHLGFLHSQHCLLRNLDHRNRAVCIRSQLWLRLRRLRVLLLCNANHQHSGTFDYLLLREDDVP